MPKARGLARPAGGRRVDGHRGDRQPAPGTGPAPCAVVVVSHSRQWRAFAAELATRPDMIAGIRATHKATADGALCTACTTPGRGTPQARWPCAIVIVAVEADRLRALPPRT